MSDLWVFQTKIEIKLVVNYSCKDFDHAEFHFCKNFKRKWSFLLISKLEISMQWQKSSLKSSHAFNPLFGSKLKVFHIISMTIIMICFLSFWIEKTYSMCFISAKWWPIFWNPLLISSLELLRLFIEFSYLHLWTDKLSTTVQKKYLW